MNLFKAVGENLSYNDVVQLDGAFSVVHINYGESPFFDGIDGKYITIDSRENSISSKLHIENVIEEASEN